MSQSNFKSLSLCRVVCVQLAFDGAPPPGHCSDTPEVEAAAAVNYDVSMIEYANATAVCDVPGPLSGFIGSATSSSNSTTSASLGSLSAKVKIGDVLLVAVQTSRPGSSITLPDGWSQIITNQSSGGTDRVTVITRIAAGDALDQNPTIVYADSTAVAEYHIALIRNVVMTVGGQNYAAYLVPKSAVSASSDLNPNAVTPTAPAPFFNWLIDQTSNGFVSLGYGYAFTTPPAGYTQTETTKVLFAPDYQMQMLSAYSISSAPTESPTAFAYTGSILTGGTGSILLRIPFTPI